MQSRVAKTSINMLINTIHSFAPLQVGYLSDELQCWDKKLIISSRKSMGLSSTDSCHGMFLPSNNFGQGVKTFTETDIKASARELEVLLNGINLDSKALRSRWQGVVQGTSSHLNTPNHILNANLKLARYGIYFRDSKDGYINSFLDILAAENKLFPIGSNQYNSPYSALLGSGLDTLLQPATGGSWYKALYKFKRGDYSFKQLADNLGFIGIKSLCRLKKLIARSKECIFDNSNNCINFHEWTWSQDANSSKNTTNINNCWNDASTWKFRRFDLHSIKSLLHSEEDILWQDIWKCCKEHINIDFEHYFQANTNIDEIPDSYSTWDPIIEEIMISQSPLIVATDGGKQQFADKNCTSASIVLGLLDIRIGESIQSGEWIDRPIIPLIIRGMILPTSIGVNSSSANYGEALAACMQEEILPPNIARCTILDSQAIRYNILDFRNNSISINRKIIRHSFSGIGKSIMGRLKHNIDLWHSFSIKHLLMLHSEEYSNFLEDLHERHLSLLQFISNAIDSNISGFKKWNILYQDNHNIRSFLKVDSHQLKENGQSIDSQKSRYNILIPCKALLYANHVADAGTTIVLQKQTDIVDSHLNGNDDLQHWHRPYSTLRFYFTWNGKRVDKDISIFIDEIFRKQRLINLQHKETQGLLARIFPFCSLNTDSFSFNCEHKRVICGLSNTHTRCVYKNAAYKELNLRRIWKSHFPNQSIDLFDSNFGKIVVKDEELNCPYCFSPSSQRGFHTWVKGNRRHLFLFCPHAPLSSFRQTLNDLIEVQGRQLFCYISSYLGDLHTEAWFSGFSDILCSLQSSNVGRLHNPPTNFPISTSNYWHLNKLLKHFHILTLREAIIKNISIFCYIFGVCHQLQDGALLDQHYGVVDSIYLGILPRDLDNYIRSTMNNSVSLSFHAKHRVKHIWNTIKSLITKRALGLHRICASVSSAHLKSWKNLYQPSSHNEKSFTRKQASQLKRKNAICAKKGTYSPVSNHRYSSFSSHCDHQFLSKTCRGSTCLNENNFWYTKLLSTATIKYNCKQCQRCAKFLTALRKCISLGELVISNHSNIPIDFLMKHIDGARSKKTFYFHMKSILSYLENVSSTFPFRFLNKNGYLLDNTKLSCHMFCTIFAIQHKQIFHPSVIHSLPNAFTWNDIISTLQSNIISWKKETTSQSNPVANRIQKRQIIELQNNATFKSSNILPSKLILSNDAKPIHQFKKQKLAPLVNLPSSSSTSNSCNNDDIISISSSVSNNSHPSFPQRYLLLANDVLQTNEPMSDSIIDNAVSLLRKVSNRNTFIASSFFSTFISQPGGTSWPSIGRFFRNPIAFNRGDGLYLIPSFYGGEDFGHWFVNFIHMVNGQATGYTLDSLGTGYNHNKSLLRQQIMSGFGINSLRNWIDVPILLQTELECGPRCVWNIALLCIARKHHIPLNLILEKIKTMDNTSRINSAKLARNDVFNIISTQSGNALFHRIFPPISG